MYSRILVPIDLDDPSSWQETVPAAVALARSFGSEIALVHVVSDLVLQLEAEWSGLALRRILDTARAKLGLLANQYDSPKEISVHVATGSIYRGILDLAERENVDLIVMAPHRPRPAAFLLGENAERVVRHAKCSVLIVRR